MTNIASAIDPWQGSLRRLLEAYLNGEYLRRGSRWLFPLAWALKVEAVEQGLADLGRASLALGPYSHDPALIAFRDRLEAAFRSVHNNPEAALLGVLVEGYALLGRLWRLEEELPGQWRDFPSSAPPDLPAWRQDDRYFTPIGRLVDFAQQKLRPYLDLALLHGSLADLRLCRGYSDCDDLLVLARDTVLDTGRLAAFARLCYRSRALLNAFDPLQHHGHMVITAVDLEGYPEAWLPLTALSAARPMWQPTGPLRVRVRDSHALAVAAFEEDVDYFRLVSAGSWRPGTAYELKDYLSILMLLPTRYLQAKGIFTSKRDSFALARQKLPEADWGIMDHASMLRSYWPYPFSPATDWLREVPGFINLQMLRGAHRLLLPGSRHAPAFLAQEHLTQAAALAEALHADVFRAPSQVAVMGGSLAGPARTDAAASIAIVGHPTRRDLSDYTAARERYTWQVAAVPGVSALYEFGSVGAPGLSDLDFLVAVSDESSRLVPQRFSIAALPFAARDLVMHEPIVIPDSLLPWAHDFLVGADLHALWRRSAAGPHPIVPDPSVLKYTQAAVLLEKLFSHLCWIEEVHLQPRVDARWCIAILRSLVHGLSLLESVTAARPAGAAAYLAAAEHVKRCWLEEPSHLTKNDLVRDLFALGEEVACDAALQLDAFLLASAWLPAGDGLAASTDGQRIGDSPLRVSFGQGRHGRDAGIARLPISFLRLIEAYSAAAPRLAPALTVKVRPTALRGPGKPSEFESYLCQRARRIEAQTVFLRHNGFSFGSLLPSHLLQLVP